MKNIDTYNFPITLGIATVISFIQEAHAGQKYGNMPYFFHPVEVANEVMLIIEKMSIVHRAILPTAIIAALLHDVIEDTKYTAKDLRTRFSDEIVDIVELLSLKSEKSYHDNIQAIIDSSNIMAMLVKLADNRVNRNGDKSSFKPEKAKRLNDRYDVSIQMLTEALFKHGVNVRKI